MDGKDSVRQISDEMVIQKTGKSWAQWFGILDQWGVLEQGATLTARYLQDEYGIDYWWAQAIAMRYEYEHAA